MTLVDGQRTEHVPVTDRGLLYGDSLFETIRFADGNAGLWAHHMGRLAHGCRVLSIPGPDPDLLLGEARAVAGDLGDCVVRVTVTRGDGTGGYAPSSESTSRRIVRRIGPVPRDPGPVEAVICATRLPRGGPAAGLKHGSRVEQVLVAAEVRDAGAGEGIVLDTRDFVVEGVSANLFLLVDDHWLTPDLDGCGVAGVFRAWLLASGHVQSCAIDLDTLAGARSLFFANAVRGIMPVRSVRGMGDFDPAPARELGKAVGTPW